MRAYSCDVDELPHINGIPPINDPPIGDWLFVGWKAGVLAYDIIGNYSQFEEDYWDLLRQGFPLIDAVNDSLPPAGGQGFWRISLPAVSAVGSKPRAIHL